MTFTSEAERVDEIQLAETISPMVLERAPQVNELPEALAPTMLPRHNKAQLAAIMIMLYLRPQIISRRHIKHY